MFLAQGNWVDLVIIIVLVYFVSDSWRIGFWVVMADFLGFFLSLVAALFGYSYASSVLQNNFTISRSLANPIGFLLVAGFSEVIFSLFFLIIAKRIPFKFWKEPWNKMLATIPSLGQGLIISAFILTLTMSLPVFPRIKADINASKIGGFLLKETTGMEAQLTEIFGGLVEDSLTYLTVHPGSQESIALKVEDFVLSVDEASEKEMLRFVNEERRKRGINELSVRSELVPVARAHARDMWERQYFGHISPEGKDVGYRLSEHFIAYKIAGENLALAPTVQTAHTGLMNSEGHKRNILDPEFNQIGVGVIDNGYYGKMFVQVFTD